MGFKPNEREYRSIIEINAIENDDEKKEKRVSGYACTFNQQYTLMEFDDEEYREQIDSHAFDDCNMDDVIMQYDHEGRVFARTRNNTLSLETDEHGLKIDADLGGTEIGRNLYEEIRGGYTDKMSFGFVVADDEWKEFIEGNKHIWIRTIKRISKLYDVSAVSIPANDATSISVRNLCDGEISKIKAERLSQRKLEIEQAIIKAKIKAM